MSRLSEPVLGRVSPRYWPTRVGLWLLQRIAPLGCRAHVRIGSALGRIVMWLSRKRRRIVRANLQACFPQLGAQQLDRLVRENFEATGISLCELGRCWYAPHSVGEVCRLRGLEHLDAALKAGRGAQVVAFHLTSFELGGSALAQRRPLAAVYAPSDDPVLEAHCRRGRMRNAAELIPRENVRAMVRYLKRNGVLWYTVDDDSSLGRKLWLPLLGVDTAFLPTASRFSRITGAPVLPLTQRRLPDGEGVEVTLHPPLAGVAGDDEKADTQQIVAFFEEYLRAHPADYLWARRRFRTPAPGDTALYEAGPRRRTVSARRYRHILRHGRVLESVGGRPRTVRTAEGDIVKCFHRAEHWSVDWLVSPARGFAKRIEALRRGGRPVPRLVARGYCPAFRCHVLRYHPRAGDDVALLMDGAEAQAEPGRDAEEPSLPE